MNSEEGKRKEKMKKQFWNLKEKEKRKFPKLKN